MASVQDLKRRVRSVKNTRKITKAMELVAAARLRRAQTRIEAMRPYADLTRDLVVEAAARANVRGQRLLERREPRNVAILALTGDRGLSGAFNTQIVRRGIALGREHEAAGRGVVWFIVGKRGVNTFRFRGYELRDAWQGITERPSYLDAQVIADTVIEGYCRQDFDLVQLVYNRFESALSQRVETIELLPVPQGELADMDARERALQGDVLFEPAPEEMLDELLRTATETTVYRAMLESTASAYGAQMTAMGNASKNANDL